MDKKNEPICEYETDIHKCIAGLTEYAGGLAANRQEDRLHWLYGYIEDMAEFWGIENIDRYLTAFEQTVSEARNTGQAAELSEQTRADILTGLEQYADEMLASCEEQDLCYTGCVRFMQELKEEWQYYPEQKTEKPDCALIGEDGNIFNLSSIAARTLRENGLQEQAEELQRRIFDGGCGDYSAALRVISEYVNITEKPEQGMIMGGM